MTARVYYLLVGTVIFSGRKLLARIALLLIAIAGFRSLKKPMGIIAHRGLRALYWIFKKIFKGPILFSYALYLKTHTRLKGLGIRIRNPFGYFFSSKSIAHISFLLCALAVVIGNLVLREQPPDFFQPQNPLARMVIITDEEFIEENAPPQIAATEYNPLSGVRQTPDTLSNPEQKNTAQPGDIAFGAGALIKPILPTTEARRARPNALQYYVVKAGDTPAGIAKKFGLKLTTILWTNNLTSKSTLRIGQRLTVLPTNGLLYTVRRGDTLARIAGEFQSDAREIIAMNDLKSPNDLSIGQLLILPNAVRIRGVEPPTRQQPSTLIARLKNILTPQQTPYARLFKLVWPTTARRITQYYSWRHSGIDIAGPPSNRIVAAADGVVVFAGWQRGYGRTIILDHGNGNKTRYAHASRLVVDTGEYIEQGQTIAMIGSTGRSTGPHLHFEVFYQNRRMNPLSFVR